MVAANCGFDQACAVADRIASQHSEPHVTGMLDQRPGGQPFAFPPTVKYVASFATQMACDGIAHDPTQFFFSHDRRPRGR
jgi:hypothetical protein